jgi:sarcosine oxidase subunit beta
MAEELIIGAGVIGCSIAYHLAKMGCRDVVVLEKEHIGSGSTGKCPGGIRQQFSSEINIKLSIESVDFFDRFEEETGHPADFHHHGYLMLATTGKELETFHCNAALQRKLGVEVYLLSPQEVAEMVALLNVEDILGATYCPSDGCADPYSVVHGFASAAGRLGAKIYEETEVMSIKVNTGRVQGVLTSKGEFAAPVVISAAGPYVRQIGEMVGLDIPARPSRRHMFVTEPLPQHINSLSPAMVVDFHNGFWFHREGLCLIFGMRNPDEPEGFDTCVDWGLLTKIAEPAYHRLPFLEHAGVMRGQAGLHCDTPDYHAILGKVPEIEGLYLACGFSGHGFMHSPAVGKAMAELILEGKPALDISALAPERFQAGTYKKEECFI